MFAWFFSEFLSLEEAQLKSKDKEVLQSFREEFYKLYPGNWHAQIADLGDIIPGESLEDTYYAIKTLVAYLIKQRVVPIVIGRKPGFNLCSLSGI